MSQDFSLPPRNRRVLLQRRPTGIPQEADFRVIEDDIPKIEEGLLLVRNLYLSVDPAQKGWASDAANYSTPVGIGETMRALAVGRVVESRDPSAQAGDLVYGWFGWQDYAAVGADQILTRTDSPVLPASAYAGILGINGMTAWLALHLLGRPVSGETLLVTTAAGAVGSAVGQIGRSLGCRTVGVTGSDAKVTRCLDRFGFDTAVNYRTVDPGAIVAGRLPEGADILFDNVGGPLLDHFLRAMRVGGRVIQCGTASVERWQPPPLGPRNEREVLTRRLSWAGFIIFDHRAHFPAAQRSLADMCRAGTLVYDEHIERGIDRAPGAIARLYAGENEGKLLISLE